jgi:hypothetical protein
VSNDLVVGDTLSRIDVAFVLGDGTSPDLTGASVTLRYRILLGAERTPGELLSRDMIVDDPLAATAYYELQQEDLLAGIMRCEFEVTLADTRVSKSLELVDFTVRGGL